VAYIDSQNDTSPYFQTYQHTGDTVNTLAIFNGTISHPNITKFQSMLEKFDQGGTITLVLSTLDGDLNSATSLASYLHERFSSLRLVVLSVCEGPGVKIVHGADELIFGEKGTIGSIVPNQGGEDWTMTSGITATELYQVSELTVAEHERIKAVDDWSSSIPLPYNTFICIDDGAGKREDFTDRGDHPILRSVDVFRHYGMHGY
jgi:hypothetical protein